jgi:DNA-binding IclR family transcriptional regulator
MLGLNAVAAPIFDSHDACVAALALVGSIQFLPEKPKPSDVDALIKASRQVSRKLGHAGPQEATAKRRKATAAH